MSKSHVRHKERAIENVIDDLRIANRALSRSSQVDSDSCAPIGSVGFGLKQVTKQFLFS